MALVSCSSQPADETIIEDWKTYWSEYYRGTCTKYIKLKDVRVVGKSVKDNQCEVIISITGDWISNNIDPRFFPHLPCGGFTKKKGANQTVEKKMLYKKYDTGWRLEM